MGWKLSDVKVYSMNARSKFYYDHEIDYHKNETYNGIIISRETTLRDGCDVGSFFAGRMASAICQHVQMLRTGRIFFSRL